MSRTSRARKLSALTSIGHQQAVQHLEHLGLGIQDEREYVNSLAGGGAVHRQTCACAREFFTLTSNAALCPHCAKVAPSVGIAEPAQQMNHQFREMMDKANPAQRLQEMMDKANPVQRLQEMMDKANPAQRLQEMMDMAHSARSLHDMMSASDPARRLLEAEMLERAHSARSLHDMMSASDPARRLQEMKMAEKAHSARSFQDMMDAADPRKPR